MSDPIKAAQEPFVQRALDELKAMPLFTHACILILSPDALGVRIVTTLNQDATREVLTEAASAMRGERGQVSGKSKLILPPGLN